MKHTITVSGMHCKSCSALIKMALEDIGAKNIKIVVDEKAQTGNVSAEHTGQKADLIKAIEKEGYKAK